VSEPSAAGLFADLFDARAGDYARSFGASGRAACDSGRALALDLLQASRDEVILDLACGPAILTTSLVERVGPGGLVIGGDRAPRMLALARSRSVVSPRLVLIRMDFGSLPLRTGSIDGVVCGHGLHFALDLPAALAEVARVLRPGGRFTASIARDAAKSAVERTLDGFVRWAVGPPPFPAEWLDTHAVVADTCQLAAAYCQAGFNDARLREGYDEWRLSDPRELVHATLSWWGNALLMRGMEPAKRRQIANRALDLVQQCWAGDLVVRIPWVVVATRRA
jgi:SAM-dependent methyltransferase